MFQFPANPLLGDLFTPIPGVIYKWNGTGWAPVSTAALTKAEADALYIALAQKGAANGVATLDAGIKVPMAQLQAGVANGLATLAADLLVAQAQLPDALNRNIVIGGDFHVNPWQRGVSFPAIADGAYHADRWRWSQVGTGVVTISKGANAPTPAQAGMFTGNSLIVDVTTADAAIAAGDLYTVEQRVYGYDFAGISGRAFTLGFWHAHTKTGIYSVGFRNNALDQAYIAEYTQAVADAWEFASVTVPANPGNWNHGNGIGLRLSFALAGGANFQNVANAWVAGNFLVSPNQVNAMDSAANFFRLNLIQLQPGIRASRFLARSFSEERLLCHPFYRKSFDDAVAPATNAGQEGAAAHYIQVAGVAGQGLALIHLDPPMRTTVYTVTTYNPAANNANWRNVSTGTDSGVPQLIVQGQSGFALSNNQAATDTQSDRCSVQWTADAEL